MKTEDIDKILESTLSPCISITVPIDHANKSETYNMIKKGLQKAKALLKSTPILAEVKKSMIVKVESVTPRVPESYSDGLGIFISPDRLEIIALPFNVKFNVILSDRFVTRDLQYLRQYASTYLILNLSKKGVHLYSDTLNELNEITDEHFPLLYEDQFEYEHASIADSSSRTLKGFERDKNEISEIRLKAAFREADAKVTKYLSNETKILLAGPQRMIALFKSVTALKNRIAGKISGSYSDKNIEKLQKSAWESIIRERKNEIEKEIASVKEEQGGHLAQGLEEAWSAATEGRGSLLMVEKDLHHRGYQKETDGKLHLQPPRKPYKVIPDAVDGLIETVRSKNGKVIFTENDQLKAFNHVALVLRY